MRPLHPLLAALTLLVSACGDNGQQAQAPSDSELREGRTTQQAARQEANRQETTGTIGRPATPPATPSATPSPSATATPPAGAQPGQPPQAQPSPPQDRIAPAISGRTFTSDTSWIQFSSDNRFTMRDKASERVVRGRYGLEGDRITFSEPQGETNGMTFPMTCRIQQASANAFKLDDPACAAFNGQTFQAEAG